MKFDEYKYNALSKKDKSNKGSIDKKIEPLINKINSLKNYFTTSSCSGRIILIKKTDKKVPNIFLLNSHAKISKEKIKDKLKNKNGIFYLKMEPCALHVTCRRLEDAQTLLNLARNSGWKKSGIISSKKFFICELFSTESICAPITSATDESYLNLLVNEANDKLNKTNKKITKLLRSITEKYC